MKKTTQQWIAIAILLMGLIQLIKLILNPEVPVIAGTKIATASATVIEENKDDANEKFGNHTLYQATVFKYLAVEGLILDEYECAAGYRTFGIGCVVDTPEEEELVRSGVTYEKAVKHLMDEHLKMVQRVEKDAPGMYNRRQKYALAMLYLSIGYERFWKKNQRLRRAYEEGHGIPERTWLKQCNYLSKKTGKYVRSEHLYRSKQFEVALFKGNEKELIKRIEAYKKVATKLQETNKVWRQAT